jgi:hypothetical protein
MHTTTTVTVVSFAELRTIEAIHGKAVEIESVTEGNLTAVPYLIDHDPESGIYYRVFRTADCLTDTGYDVNVGRDDGGVFVRLVDSNWSDSNWSSFVEEFVAAIGATEGGIKAALRYVARHGDRIC